jgi:phosphopantothenoylcysteine decarboxylase/phosphopantothenate--cysteine ligase
MQSCLSEAHFDSVIHAAAVSDFSVEKTSGKRSSENDLTLHLRKNPKLINFIKEWSLNKDVNLIGFKLTSQVTEEVVLSKVQSLMKESHADLIIQNDAQVWADRNKHEFQLFFAEKKEKVVGVESLVSGILKEGLL